MATYFGFIRINTDEDWSFDRDIEGYVFSDNTCDHVLPFSGLRIDEVSVLAHQVCEQVAQTNTSSDSEGVADMAQQALDDFAYSVENATGDLFCGSSQWGNYDIMLFAMSEDIDNWRRAELLADLII